MPKKIGLFFLDFVQSIIFAVSIFLFLYLLVLQPHKIKGISMSPNHPDGEFLLTDKISYRFREPQRGEIIVFKAPVGNGDDYIKRIIGLPNETVSIKDGEVIINGKPLKEDYINVETSAGYFLEEGKEIKVPEGNYFVLGDNRPHSSDSRHWGFVEKRRIIGRAWLIYWPLERFGIIKTPIY